MAGKYEPLTDALRAVAERGQEAVELGFDELEELVGRLPPSAELRQWWANSSHTQALAWRAAGFHVDQVYLDGRRVRFARGARGGAYRDRGHMAVTPRAEPTTLGPRVPVGQPIDVRVLLHWLDAGSLTLDALGKPAFPRLEQTPGLYRLTLADRAAPARRRVYVGETENLQRRLSGNYRSPGPRQQTSLRINALLREHLATGGEVHLAVATAATVWLMEVEQSLDLARKACRLLAENAALVLEMAAGEADIVNLE